MVVKASVAVWCDFTDTRCPRRVLGDNKLQALDFARMNGWQIEANRHLCPFHRTKRK